MVTPENAKAFGFTLKNEGREPASLLFSVALTSPSETEKSVEQTMVLRPGEERKVSCPLDGLEMGAWSAAYTISQKKSAKDDIARTVNFGYMEPAGPNETRPKFLFGVISHSERLPLPELHRELEAAAFAGCKVLRAGPEWQNIQPAPDQWKWEVMDDMVATAAQQGMELEALLAYGTKWAAPLDKQRSPDAFEWQRAAPDLAAWRKFVSTFAERYKGRIRLWEPWNEPDLEGFWRGSTDQYIELVRATIEELRKVSPDNIVMSGGFATIRNHEGRNLNPDLQERTMRTLGPRLDLHAVHEHGPFQQLVEVVDHLYATLRASLPPPVPPLFFNETAIPSVGNTGVEQAQVLVKKATFVRSRGAVGYLWYDLRNDGTEPGNVEHHFGLLNHDMEPKPAYVAFNTYARLAVPLPYLKQLELGKGRWFFLHGDEKKKLLVFWNDDPGSQNEQILLRLTGASRASLIDINGNATPLRLADGLAVVSSSKEPRYLLAEGADSIEPAGKLASPSRTFFGAPAEEIAVACEFTNPTDASVDVHLQWEALMALTLESPEREKLTIPPHGHASASARVRMPTGKHYRLGEAGKLQMDYDFAGTPYKGRIKIPVHYGTIAIPADREGRKADVVLDRAEQIFSFIEADPHLQQYRWKNPQDLSARAWISAGAEEICLRVEVTDNKHFQDKAANDIWRGDSVQCALAVPGADGFWEFGFAEDATGNPVSMIWSKPPGGVDFLSKMSVEVEKRGEGRVYTARLPRGELGLTDKVLMDGFRLNLAVNDNDGMIRAHAIQLAPGIVENKSMEAAPYVIFKELPTAP